MSADPTPAQPAPAAGEDHQTHLWVERPEQRGDHLVLSAKLKRPGEPTSTLWYRIPREFERAVSLRADSFVVASVFLAMRAGWPVLVHGAPVSPSLLRNLEEFQAVWAFWRPEWYRAVPITGEIEEEAAFGSGDGRDSIVAFSGGVDSAFTLYRHHRQLCGRRSRPIGAALMVHGFDIPLSDEEGFRRAAERSGRMPQSLGVPLFTLATNVKDLPHDWLDAHASTLASCLMLFQQRCNTGLIASSQTYEVMALPYGSSPLTNPFLSSDLFGVIHDGAETTRSEKVRTLSEWSEARHFLRVCWEDERRDKNCGRCKKCVYTILIFKALGLDHPECFERDVEAADIERVKHLGFAEARTGLGLILRQATDASITEPWVSALEKLLSRQGGALQRLADAIGLEGLSQQAELDHEPSDRINPARSRAEKDDIVAQEDRSAADERLRVVHQLEAGFRIMRAGLEEKERMIAALREELGARLRVIEDQARAVEEYRSAADERLRVVHQLDAYIKSMRSGRCATG